MAIRMLADLDQASAWGNLKAIQAATIELASGRSLHQRHGGADRLLSVRETATQLGVHENTIRNWVDKGVMKAVRLPGSQFRRVPSTEVERIRRGIMGALSGSPDNSGYELRSGTPIDFLQSDDL